MTALIQAHAQDRVSRLDKGGVGGEVGIGPRMRLHVRKATSEQLARALAGKVLDHIDALAPAVVATTRVALCVLVREHAAHGFEHRGTREVFGGDELDGVTLTGELPGYGGGDSRVGSSEVVHGRIGHGAPFCKWHL